MIHISLEGNQSEIIRRRDTRYSLALLLPMVYEINQAVKLLRKKCGVHCNVDITICDKIKLEVKNAQR